MSYFAQIDDNNVVITVLSVEQDFIDSGQLGDSSKWIKTSYNTRGGVYYTPNTNTPHHDQSKALRKNYAGVGFIYDRQRDAFIPPKPFNSWVLNEQQCLWYPPIAYPTDNNTYEWDETSISWKKIN